MIAWNLEAGNRSYLEELELERERWRLRPGDLERERRRAGERLLGERDLQEHRERTFVVWKKKNRIQFHWLKEITRWIHFPRLRDWPSPHAWRAATPHRWWWGHSARGGGSTRWRADSLSQHGRCGDFLSVNLTCRLQKSSKWIPTVILWDRSTETSTPAHLRPCASGPSGCPRGSQTPRRRSPWTGVGGAYPLACPPFLFSHKWKRSPGCGPVQKKVDGYLLISVETNLLDYLWRNIVILDEKLSISCSEIDSWK